MSPTWQGADLDEIAPNRFIISNDKTRPFLRGEGVIDGNHFDLQTWRREGLVGRLRDAGFSVRTLRDRVEALPSVKPDIAYGSEVFRPKGTAKEQVAAFDGQRLRWRDLPVKEHDGKQGVWVRINEPIRRRKSRSGGDFFVIQTGAGLLALSEQDAVMRAYSIIANQPDGGARVHFVTEGERYVVAGGQIVLPSRHAETLDFLSESRDRWTFGPATSALAEEVFGRLGITLVEDRP